MAVHPGDLIHVDENGVVLVPKDRVRDVIDPADKLIERERGIIQLARRPDFSVEMLKEMLGRPAH